MLNQKRIGTSRKKRYKRLIRALAFHSLFTLILFGLFLSVISLLSRIPAFTISSIEAKGNAVTPSEDVAAVVRERLSGSYYHTVAKRNTFVYPKSDIAAGVMAAYPRIYAVETERVGRTGLLVRVAERRPGALWCGEAPPKQGLEADRNSESCYYIDPSGYIYSKAPLFTGRVFFTYYGPIGPGEPVGQHMLSQDRFAALERLKSAVSEAGLKPVSLALSEENDVEVWIEDGSRVLCTEASDPAKLASDISSILASDDFKKELAETPAGLDYIDFRFSGRVFYKFK
jgi:hypothetical protein